MIDGYGGGPPNIWLSNHATQRNACKALERDRHWDTRSPSAWPPAGPDWRLEAAGDRPERDPTPARRASCMLMHARRPDGDGTPDSSNSRAEGGKIFPWQEQEGVATAPPTPAYCCLQLRARPAARHDRPTPRPVVGGGVESPTVAYHCVDRSIIFAWVGLRRRRRGDRVDWIGGSCCDDARFRRSSDDDDSKGTREQKKQINDRPLSGHGSIWIAGSECETWYVCMVREYNRELKTYFIGSNFVLISIDRDQRVVGACSPTRFCWNWFEFWTELFFHNDDTQKNTSIYETVLTRCSFYRLVILEGEHCYRTFNGVLTAAPTLANRILEEAGEWCLAGYRSLGPILARL